MDELFGVSMNVIMVALLALLLPALAWVAVLAWRNPIMVKLGLRNIPRRKAQTVLIIVGIMLSSVIMAAAFGTGDTINYSIRNEAIEILGPIDEIITSARATSEDRLGSLSYFPHRRFQDLQRELEGWDAIDGLSPGIGETAPVVNRSSSLSEGRMRVAGVDPLHIESLGSLTLVSGGVARLEALGEGEAYLNEKAAEELEAVPGDELGVFVSGSSVALVVKGVVQRGGLAGDTSTLIVPLARAQELFRRSWQINSIAVSNRGDETAGAKLSEEVTRRLRVIFADPEVASELKELLSRDGVLRALESREGSLRGEVQQDLALLRQELRKDGTSEQLISLLADPDVSGQVLNALDRGNLRDVEREADTLYADLGEYRVFPIKRSLLDEAETASSFVTSFFVILGLFSIMVGVLLIFLIFVMLAAARMAEMGMARAVGARRSHLVQMYLFEGTAYSLVSAAVGVLLGLLVSAVIVVIVNRIISGFDPDFTFTRHFEVRSAVVAYCLGMIITLLTVAISAYRVSRLNIVAAVRGLPTPLVVAATGWREILLAPWRATTRTLRAAASGAAALATAHPVRALGHLRRALWGIPSIGWAIAGSVFQALWRPFKQGWLAFLLGALITWAGMAGDQAAPFRIGVSLAILGIGLMIRTVLLRTAMRDELRDRIAYTFIGVVMLIFWVLPFEVLRAVAGQLRSDIEMFFISGISMVAAAVWTVMYNSDLILKGLTAVTGRIGRLRPVLVTAVAYPMSAKFRTGLTLAMFALVMFTLIVMSILTNVFDVSQVDQSTVTGGWDVEGTVNFAAPIDDIRAAIEGNPSLRIQDYTAIGGYTRLHVEARQTGAEEQRWRSYAARVADDDFLDATRYKLKLIARGYGSTDGEVWQALRQDPSLAVVDADVVPRRSGFDDSEAPFQLEGLYYEDDEMDPIDIEVRVPRTGQVVSLRVIGVLDQLSDSFGELGFGLLTSRARLVEVIPFPVPTTTYRFRLAEGVDPESAAKALERSFGEHGMETEVLEEEVRQRAATNRAFNYIFTGFMGLGLMVGIAALGVISLRAVVERRQQIGVLRAIGYRRQMIQLSFLLESSFVALLGIAIGVALGTVISYNIVRDVREREGIETLRFSIPWLQIGAIIAVAYLFSLAATFLPARQASRIYPAEALRYE